MNFLAKTYYRLTAYLPRRIPRAKDEFAAMKRVMIEAYGVPDEPDSWAAVGGALASTPAWKLRRPWGHIANGAKRLRINAVCHQERMESARQCQALFEAKVAEIQKAQAEMEKANGIENPAPVESEAHVESESAAAEVTPIRQETAPETA